MKTLEQIRDEKALQQHIYEPKYGGKDHSGYDTKMKYEINYEREDCFLNGWDACDQEWRKIAEELEARLKNALWFQNKAKNFISHFEDCNIDDLEEGDVCECGMDVFAHDNYISMERSKKALEAYNQKVGKRE